MTSGNVMNGPASSGQHVRIGSWLRSTASPVATTSWQGPPRTVLGKTEASSVTFGIAFSFPRIPSGGFGSRKNSSREFHSSHDSICRARSMRRREPNALIATGISEPSTFSKRRAGPPAFTHRSAISEISHRGDTRCRMRTRSPSASSARRNSPRLS